MEKLTPKHQSLKEIYSSLPKGVKAPRTELLHEIIRITMKSEATVRGWLAGHYTPDTLTQSVLEKHFDIPAKTLFPKSQE